MLLWIIVQMEKLIKEKIKESGYPAIVGPALTHKSKFELANKSFTTPKTLMDEGVLVNYNRFSCNSTGILIFVCRISYESWDGRNRSFRGNYH